MLEIQLPMPLALNTGPGPQEPVTTVFEDNKAFYGEVPSSEFIQATALATLVGLSTGTVVTQSNFFPWLKFGLDNRILFVSKRNLRHTITWNNLQAVNIVDGSRIITINQYQYRIRLLKGVAPGYNGTWTVGYDTAPTVGSEWNRLMYNLLPQYSASYPQDSQIGVDWANYAPIDIDATSTKTTYYSWTPELYGAESNRVHRGNNSLSHLGRDDPALGLATIGWRPCLELVP